MRTKDAMAALSRTLALFNDPLRLRLFLFFRAQAVGRRKELCVSDLARHLGSSLSNTSHQLKKLALAGLVEPHRRGKMICYRFKRTPFNLTIYNFLRALERRQR